MWQVLFAQLLDRRITHPAPPGLFSVVTWTLS